MTKNGIVIGLEYQIENILYVYLVLCHERLALSQREVERERPVPSPHTFVLVQKKLRVEPSVTASDFGSNGPRFESGRGRCVESLDKALYSHCPKEKPSH